MSERDLGLVEKASFRHECVKSHLSRARERERASRHLRERERERAARNLDVPCDVVVVVSQMAPNKGISSVS